MTSSSTAPADIGFFVFDIESVADGDLVARVRFPDQQLTSAEAIAKYQADLVERTGSDFIPYTHQIPIAAVIAKVRHDFTLADIVCLDEPNFRPHVMTEHFWRGWDRYGRPTFVSFNGRSFDIPLMELAAYRYGVPAATWFDEQARSFEQPRYRYNSRAHIDLQDLLVNYGATRFNGGLDLAAALLGKPGKIDVRGDMVQAMYDAGQVAEINDYCRCDVLDTYFVFLRSRVLMGYLPLAREKEIVAQTKSWLEERSAESTAYSTYLAHWSDWRDPWQPAVDADPGTTDATDASPSPSAGADADADADTSPSASADASPSAGAGESDLDT